MQIAPMEFAEVQKFRFNADVQASDGEAGKVVSVVADPGRRAVTHVGVRVGALFGKTYYVPLNLISAADDNTVTVSVPLDDITKLTGKPSGTELTGGTHVSAGGKSLGHLVQLTINRETQVLRHLVVDRLGREHLVNAAMITDLTPRQIIVDLGGLQPGRLTPYRSDADLRQAVYDTLYDYYRLRIDLPGIEVHAIDGVVWLRGHVSSDVNRRIVEDLLQGLPGMSELHNELFADNQLAAAVSLAIAHDPRTASQRIGVYPRLGAVSLRGVVQTPMASAAAVEIARTIPGVKDVLNELRINPRLTTLPDLAAVTNREDMVPGGT
jgi:osmotically-inducible protein OsmY